MPTPKKSQTLDTILIEIINDGSPSTRFMEPGDRVRIQVFGPDDTALFGTIEQSVVAQ